MDPAGRRSRRLSRVELVAMLAESLGSEKALQAVTAGAATLGLVAADFDREEALRLLDHLAAEQGLVGIVARFAKARVILAVK